MKDGISIQKENAVTAFATTVVVVKEKFDAHFKETVELLLACLAANPGPHYRQFRAQIIEAITLISSAVTPETFKTMAEPIIQHMVYIQQSSMDPNDP